MSRRSRLTVEVLVRMPLPAGATAPMAKQFIELAIQEAQALRANAVETKGYKSSMSALSVSGVTVKVTKREVTYF